MPSNEDRTKYIILNAYIKLYTKRILEDDFNPEKLAKLGNRISQLQKRYKKRKETK